MQSLPGAGIANVRGVEEGKADIGFGNSISTVDALAGNAPFKKPHDNVCNVATLYPQYFQVVVPADAGINSVKDLKGKGVTTQPRGNTGELITAQLLKVARPHLQRREDELRVATPTRSRRCRTATRSRSALGTTIPAGVGHGSCVRARRSSCSICPTASTDMRKLNPGYTLVTVPKGTYPKQDKDVKVIGYATHIVASCKLPEDMVYTMTKAMAANTSNAGAVNKDMAKLTPEGDGRGYRRAVPSGRGEVLQGSRHHGEDALSDRRQAGATSPAYTPSRGRLRVCRGRSR